MSEINFREQTICNKKCSVSVIVPALNEESNISIALENIIGVFLKEKCLGEIIVINDGSTDGTESAVQRAIEKTDYIRLFRHEQPKGIGASFWEGVKNANGEIVVLIPGDAEVDAHEILRYLPLMDHVDMVVPFFFNRSVRSFKRRIISKLYKFIINITFGILLNYMNGTVMYRKCILEDIRLESTGFFYQTELLIKAIRKGYLYAEVPCALNIRAGGQSKALTFRSFLKVISGYVRAIYAVHILGTPTKQLVRNDSITALRYNQSSDRNQLSLPE